MKHEELVNEIYKILVYDKNFVPLQTTASNIVHVLKKCYGIDIEKLERNDKPWIG